MSTQQFFQWLRKEYHELRGSLRRLFGLSVFSHCDFYKVGYEHSSFPKTVFLLAQFRKFDAYEYAPLAMEYPDVKNPHYFYQPRPMQPMPPIDAHEYNRRFHACYTPRGSLHWFHRCRRPCSSRELLHRFSKRDSKLEEGGNAREEFWGIYARERLSFLRISVYNVVCLMPCVAFFFFWLFGLRHVGDLQNAAVPVGISLSGLTMFWGFIILGSPVHRR